MSELASHPRALVFDRANVIRLGELLLPALGGLILVGAVGASSGGYFPSTWGWIALPLALLAALGLALRPRITLGLLELATLGSLAAFVAWVGLSRVWSDAPGHSLTEVQRDLVYPLVLAVVLVLVRPRRVGELLGGTTAAITAIALYGLATRLYPDRLGHFDPIAVYRLSAPVGYWNGLGILTAIGIVLAFGIAARGRLVERILAGAALPPLAATLYFTFSRGSVIALAIGFVALLLIDTRRLQLTLAGAIVGPFAATTVLAASRLDALTTTAAPLEAATREGHRLAGQILVLAFAGALASGALALLERRWRPGIWFMRGYALAVIGAAVVGLGLVFAHFGDPATMYRDAREAFRGPNVGINQPGSDLTQRFFNLSGNGRALSWDVARDQWREQPLVGSGAGSFEWYWGEHRPLPLKLRDAHSLYAETLGELGIVGFGLLVVALALPLLAVRRARRRPLMPFAAAAYVAFLAHIGVDWDWEMPVVMIAGLLCGAALLVAGRGEGGGWRLGIPFRLGTLAVVVAAGSFAFVGLVGSNALATAETKLGEGDIAAASEQAHKATSWTRWSADPWKLIARIERVRGRRGAALVAARTATAKEPRDFDAWYAVARSARGEERRRAVAEARRLDPRNPDLAGLGVRPAR